MDKKEMFDQLMALAQVIAMLGSGAIITKEISQLAHELTGLGTGR